MNSITDGNWHQHQHIGNSMVIIRKSDVGRATDDDDDPNDDDPNDDDPKDDADPDDDDPNDDDPDDDRRHQAFIILTLRVCC